MKVSIAGAGYVGLTSGACLAEKGHRVICVDLDPERVGQINCGVAPFYEQGLDKLLKDNVGANLQASTDLHQAVLDTDLSLIAVGTPSKGKEMDLRYVREAASQIGKAMRDKREYHVVAVKSTVVPGTTDEVVLPILEEASGKKAGVGFGVGMNPEFLRQGEAVQDFMFPDRIVFGGIDGKTIANLENLYAAFGNVDRIRTNNKTAEMIKYVNNSLLATLVSFSNEMGNLCAGLGSVDVVDVMKAVHLDKRLSPIKPDGERTTPSFVSYLQAGCGFGGSCLPKDVTALIAHGAGLGQRMHLLNAVMKINSKQPQHLISILRKHYPSLKGRRIAVLGLAFKPGTDDLRESPAIPVIRMLIAERATVRAYDPIAAEKARPILGNRGITFHSDLAQTIENVDAILLVTRWEEFRRIPELLRDMEPQPLLIDGRRMLEKRSVARYEGIGWHGLAVFGSAFAEFVCHF